MLSLWHEKFEITDLHQEGVIPPDVETEPMDAVSG